MDSRELKCLLDEASHFNFTQATIAINIKVIPYIVNHLLNFNLICSKATPRLATFVLSAINQGHCEAESFVNHVLISIINLVGISNALEQRTKQN